MPRHNRLDVVENIIAHCKTQEEVVDVIHDLGPIMGVRAAKFAAQHLEDLRQEEEARESGEGTDLECEHYPVGSPEYWATAPFAHRVGRVIG